MDGDDNTRALVRHEDDDPLVVAAAALGDTIDVCRKPGLITVRARSQQRGIDVILTRSRFDGDYGNIVRMRAYRRAPAGADAVALPMTFAPEFVVTEALSGDGSSVVDRLVDVYEEWIKKGDRPE